MNCNLFLLRLVEHSEDEAQTSADLLVRPCRCGRRHKHNSRWLAVPAGRQTQFCYRRRAATAGRLLP